MNIEALRTNNNSVNPNEFYAVEDEEVNSIQLTKNTIFKIDKIFTPSTLLCLSGEVVFEYEHGRREFLRSGNYEEIELDVYYWFMALEDSEVLLMR